MYGVDQQIKKIDENTKNFLEGLAFNHGLLWGVRGSGKSSIIRGILKNYAQKYDNFESCAHLIWQWISYEVNFQPAK